MDKTQRKYNHDLQCAEYESRGLAPYNCFSIALCEILKGNSIKFEDLVDKFVSTLIMTVKLQRPSSLIYFPFFYCYNPFTAIQRILNYS